MGNETPCRINRSLSQQACGSRVCIRREAVGIKTNRAALARCMTSLEAGDVLLVTKLDRLARSTRDSLNMAKGIKFGRKPKLTKHRTREHLTEAEVERLMSAARKNRWGHRDATMILVARKTAAPRLRIKIGSAVSRRRAISALSTSIYLNDCGEQTL